MSLANIAARRILNRFSKSLVLKTRSMSGHHEDPDELSCKYKAFFERKDIDGWDVRQGMTDLLGHDFVPEPQVIIAALHACRRVNDYSLSVRFLEAVKDSCGGKVHLIYPYIVQEIAPTMCELGCDLPESLCYHKPELWLKHIDEV